MTTVETTSKARARSWESAVRAAAFVWAAIGLVYLLMEFANLDPVLMAVWVGVEAAFIVALGVLHSRASR